MIGNDIVDLALAKVESNWKRKGYLDKIFTVQEQYLIYNSDNPEIMVWNLWSRKEAAYKIFNRQTGIRAFNPIQFENFGIEKKIATVHAFKAVYFTKTEITTEYIHSVCVTNKSDFNALKVLFSAEEIIKTNGLPHDKVTLKPASKSNHGRFERAITLI
jgi:phosphopantetheinyl transferase (holo-ACP synthase)